MMEGLTAEEKRIMSESLTFQLTSINFHANEFINVLEYARQFGLIDNDLASRTTDRINRALDVIVRNGQTSVNAIKEDK